MIVDKNLINDIYGEYFYWKFYCCKAITIEEQVALMQKKYDEECEKMSNKRITEKEIEKVLLRLRGGCC